jgi:TolA-binding protein
MKCDRCGEKILAGEEMDHHGQMLCEDCYMRALSPAIACDPWAVRSAQTLSQMDERYAALSKTQTRILQILEETGGAEPSVIAQKLQMKLPQLEREIATLRHMEKVRGKMRAGQKILCLWES